MRGTTNRNARGSSYARAQRRRWLVDTFRADRRARVRLGLNVTLLVDACRCYRCGCLLTVDTVTVDRIVPGCQGGTYRRTNIRPACARCNSVTGGATRGTR